MFKNRFKVGEEVVVERLPERFLDDLPKFDQKAILSIIDKPLCVVGVDDDRVELEFKDARGNTHWIYLDSRYVKAASSRKGVARFQPRGAKRKPKA